METSAKHVQKGRQVNVRLLANKLVQLIESGKELEAADCVKGLDAETKKVLAKRLLEMNGSVGKGRTSWDKGASVLTRIFGGGEPREY